MIIWGALTLSLVLYLIVLMILGKIQFVQFTGTGPSMLENVALISNSVLIISLFIHQKKVPEVQDKKKQLPVRIITWVLNDSVAVIAFIATLLSTTGNGSVFAINLSTAFLANVLMFPKIKS